MNVPVPSASKLDGLAGTEELDTLTSRAYRTIASESQTALPAPSADRVAMPFATQSIVGAKRITELAARNRIGLRLRWSATATS
jgi:hypothetical protein